MRRNYNWVQVRRRGEWVDNDEGYNYRYCPCCARTTEHDLNKCIPCDDRRARARRR
jgi:hypothetical protein